MQMGHGVETRSLADQLLLAGARRLQASPPTGLQVAGSSGRTVTEMSSAVGVVRTVSDRSARTRVRAVAVVDRVDGVVVGQTPLMWRDMDRIGSIAAIGTLRGDAWLGLVRLLTTTPTFVEVPQARTCPVARRPNLRASAQLERRY